jgi:hypothetical protein
VTATGYFGPEGSDLAAGEPGGADEGDEGGVAPSDHPSGPSTDGDGLEGPADQDTIESRGPGRAEQLVEGGGGARCWPASRLVGAVDGMDPPQGGRRPGGELSQEGKDGLGRDGQGGEVDGGAPVGEQPPMPTLHA